MTPNRGLRLRAIADPGAGPEGGAVVGRATAVLLTVGSGALVGLLLPVLLPLPPLVELPLVVELLPPPVVVLLPLLLLLLLLPLLLWFTAEDESALDPETVWLPLPLPWFWLLPAETDAEADGWIDDEGEGLLEAETDDMVTEALAGEIRSARSGKRGRGRVGGKKTVRKRRYASSCCGCKANNPVEDAASTQAALRPVPGTAAAVPGWAAAGWPGWYCRAGTR